MLGEVCQHLETEDMLSLGEVEMTLCGRHADRNGESQTQPQAYFRLGARSGRISSLSMGATRSWMAASCVAAKCT